MTRLVDHERLTRLLGDAGLHVIDRDDVVAQSDQFQHPLLRPGTSLAGLLFDTARRANPAAMVREFVWLCTPGPEASGARAAGQRGARAAVSHCGDQDAGSPPAYPRRDSCLPERAERR